MINNLLQKIMGMVGLGSGNQTTVTAGASAPKVSNHEKKPPAVGGYKDEDVK